MKTKNLAKYNVPIVFEVIGFKRDSIVSIWIYEYTAICTYIAQYSVWHVKTLIYVEHIDISV